MTSRLRSSLFIAATLATSAALAQPAPKVAPAPATTQESNDTFEKDLDALFVKGGLTSDQAAKRAVDASPAVRRSAADIEVAIANVEAAELSRIPQVGASVGYTRLSSIESPEIAPGFSFPVILNQYSATAQVNVTLSDYLLRYPKLIDAANLAKEVARVSRRSTEVNAGQDAKLAYYEWVRAKLQVLIAQRQLTNVRATVTQVRALADVQRVSRADLLRVESNEAQADATVTQLELLSQLREEQLRLLIDEPAGTTLTVGEDIRDEIAVPQVVTVDDALKVAREQRLEYKVIDTGIQAKEMQRSAEESAYYPKLGVFANAEYSNPNQRIFPQEEKFELTWAAGAQITWTLNETLFARTTNRRILGETNVLRADRESLDRGTRIQILSAQQAVTNANAQLVTSQKGLVASEEGYRVRRELLNAERATAVELVDAETDLTRARITALNARVDLRVALTLLSHALGADAK